MLIHLMGDLHCPMHAGHLTDLGGNRVKVRFFGRDTNLHSVWASSLPDWAHKWSYTEWQRQIDRVTRKQEKELSDGTVEEWFAETAAICAEIYKELPEGTKLSYDHVAKYAPVIEDQLLKGGRRLARILNYICR